MSPPPPGRAGRAGPGGSPRLCCYLPKFIPPLKKFFNGLLDDLPQHPCTSVLEKSVVVFPVLEDVQMDSQFCNPLTSAFCISHKLLDIRRTNHYDDYYMFGLRLLTDTVHVEQQSAVIIIMPHTPLSRRSSSALPISFLGFPQCFRDYD